MAGLVSVIIPNYNNAGWLPQCLESCLIQGEFLHEIIVVDDHSSDDSHTVLDDYKSKYPEKIYWHINERKGGNNARNYGLSKSTGKYIQWLDADDILLPRKFETQLPPLQSGKADIVYSDWRIDYWKEGVFSYSENKYYRAFPDFLSELIKDNWTSPNNYLTTRKMAETLAGGVGWNPETKVGQDREYFTMAGILGARFKYVPGVFAVYNSQNRGTVSGMAFEKRLIENQKLERRFRHEISISPIIALQKKKTYLNILHTHKLKACFYSKHINLDEPFSLFGIRWDLMHYKMRLPIFFIYIVKHIQYFIKNG